MTGKSALLLLLMTAFACIACNFHAVCAETTVSSVDGEATVLELVAEGDINDVLYEEERTREDVPKETEIENLSLLSSLTQNSDGVPNSYAASTMDRTTQSSKDDSDAEESSSSMVSSTSKEGLDQISTSGVENSYGTLSTTSALLNKIVNSDPDLKYSTDPFIDSTVQPLETDTSASPMNVETTVSPMKVGTTIPSMADADTVPPMKVGTTVPSMVDAASVQSMKDSSTVPPMKVGTTLPSMADATTVPPMKIDTTKPPMTDTTSASTIEVVTTASQKEATTGATSMKVATTIKVKTAKETTTTATVASTTRPEAEGNTVSAERSATTTVKAKTAKETTTTATVASTTRPEADGNTVSAERSATTTVDDISSRGQTYQEAEKEITDYINSLLRSLLPQIVGGSGDAKLSQKCTAAMMKVFSYIRRMKGWTVKMLDSMGKPSSGILRGTSYSMGSFEQCLQLSVSSKGAEVADPKDEMFHGQYCRVRISLPQVVIEQARRFQKGLVNATDLGRLKDIIQVIPYIPVKSNYMTHFVGLCFPSTCTPQDLEQLVQLIPFPGNASVDRCEEKTESKVDLTQLTVICIFLVLCVLVVASTFFDWLRHPKRGDKSEDGRRDKRCVSVSVSFSLCSNTRRLLRNVEEDEAGGESALAGLSVRGVAVVALAWIVIGHTYLFPNEAYYFQTSSLANLKDYWDAGYFSLVMTFPLAIDALLVCYGFLLTYSLWYSAVKPEEVTVSVISLIIKNYIRLCIPLLLCFGVIFVLPLSGSGPLWGDLMSANIDRCRQNAPAYFGMYANFLELEEQCFPHLWFVSCLAQLTLAGVFLSWILARNVKVGAWITIFLIIACNGTVGAISYWNDFPPSYLAYFTDESSSYFWQISMAYPLSHFGSYAVGMLSGIFVAKRDTRRTRGCLGAVGWVACVGLLYALLLVLHEARGGVESALWKAALAALHRTAFALCVAWVTVACAYELGGFVNAILSWRVLDPLFRLSLYAYVSHFILISFVVATSAEHFAYTHLELVLRAFSYLAATYFVSYILYMLLERPLLSLKEAFCPKKAFRIEVTPLYSAHKGDFISKSTIEGSVKLWSITESPNGVSY